MEFAEAIKTWLFESSASLPLLFLGVVLLSYLLEDLAIVTAAALAVEDFMPTLAALAAIFVGISTGDLGLYLIGKGAQRIRFLRYRLFRYQRARRIQRKLHQQAFMTLFIVRFVPGLRTVGFSLSGFLNVPVAKFLLAVISATAIWTALIFSSFFHLGNAEWLQQSQSGWLLIPLGVCGMWLLNRMIRKLLVRDSYDAARER